MAFIALSADLKSLAILFLYSLFESIRIDWGDVSIAFYLEFASKMRCWIFFWVVVIVIHHDTCKLAICQFVVLSLLFSIFFSIRIFFLLVFSSVQLMNVDFIYYTCFSLSTSFYSHKLFLLVGNFTRITFN